MCETMEGTRSKFTKKVVFEIFEKTPEVDKSIARVLDVVDVHTHTRIEETQTKELWDDLEDPTEIVLWMLLLQVDPEVNVTMDESGTIQISDIEPSIQEYIVSNREKIDKELLDKLVITDVHYYAYVPNQKKTKEGTWLPIP